MAVQARMTCQTVLSRGGAVSVPCDEGDEGALRDGAKWFRVEQGTTQIDVELTPVINSTDDDPNKSYSKYTPNGVLKLTITNPDAFGYFEPGQTYNVDISKHQPTKARR